MSTAEITPAMFWAFIATSVRNLAGVVVAVGVVWAVFWQLAQPKFDAYLDSKLSINAKSLSQSEADLKAETHAIRTLLDKLLLSVDEIERKLPEARPFIETKGGAQLTYPLEKFLPGDDVTFLYFLRRNIDCPTTVRAQFYSAQASAITPRYSYDVPAVQTPASFGFQYVSMRVPLPLDISPGWYSYVPRLIPDRSVCPGQSDATFEPSEFFEVIDRRPISE